MKRNLNLFLGICLFSFQGFSQVPTHKEEQVPVAIPKGKNVIEIPSSFAKEAVEDQEILNLLANKEVKRVELYYTQFKENPDFDQQALNEKRVNELLEKYPELKNQKIVWVWKEQTLAQTKEDASKCFHGFRIYGIDKPVAKNQVKVENTPQTKKEQPVVASKSIYKNIAIEDKGNLPTKFTIDVAKGGDFTTLSGSVLHVPANAVVDKYGKPIKGNYTIEYTEYRNQAEIAYSGLPMNYSKDGKDFVFNSAGMYTLYGKQNGKDLKLKSPITVDFNCTAQLPNLNFYQLDKTTNQWKEKHKIDFNNNNDIQNFNKQDFIGFEENNKDMSISWTVENKNAVLTFEEESWKNYLLLKEEDKDLIDKNVKAEDVKTRKVILHTVQPDFFIERVFGIFWRKQIRFHNETALNNKEGMSLLADGADKGHTYPNLVRGLVSTDFGVFNCDQAASLGEQVHLSPVFVDNKTNEKIKTSNIVCVIDHKINCSLSFDPKMISVGLKSESDILLFTTDNKTYLLPKESLATIDLSSQKNGANLQLQMIDISDKVKTSDDLKAYLKL